MVGSLESLIAKAKSFANEDAEIVRVAFPAGLPWVSLSQLSGRLRQDHPNLRIEMSATANTSTALTEGYDLVVHVGESPPSGPWQTTKLTELVQRLVASKTYVREHGEITTVRQLAAHPVMVCRVPGFDPWTIPLKGSDAPSITPVAVSDDAGVILRSVESGAGVGFVPVADTSLTQFEVLFEGAVERQLPVFLLVPTAVAGVGRVRAVVQLLRGGPVS